MKRIAIVLLALILLTGCGAKEESVQGMQHNPEKIVIALLDTGVSDAITSDHLLSGHNYVTDTDDTADQINHGTAVASIILGCESADVTGIAPSAYIVPLVVVTKQDGETVSASAEVLAQAIRDSVDVYHADIINVSLGIQTDNDALRQAVAYADSNGVTVVSAVGNGGEDGKPYYPASYDTVLAVGSCDRNGKESSFSQSGAKVLAPGEGIKLASRNGVSYVIKGTSFSTGYASAYAANILAKDPTLTPAELISKIIEQAESGGGYLH